MIRRAALSTRQKVGAAGAVAVAVVVLVIAAWAGWAMVAGRTADQVAAGWTLDCEGTKVGSHQGDPAVHSRPGWRCDVALTITNRGERPVRVVRTDAPILGSEGGAEVRGYSTDDAELRDIDVQTGEFSEAGGIDAVWVVDLEVPGRSSRTVTLAVGWRQSGCNAGGYLSLENWPTIHFETLHRTYRYSPDQPLTLRAFDDPHDAVACPESGSP